MSNECSDEATRAVAMAKKLIDKIDYRDARDCIKLAMEINPGLENVFGMLVISETLYYGDIDLLPNCVGFDCYSILYLPPSSSEAQVENRCVELSEEVTNLLGMSFPGVIDALSLLILAAVVLCTKSIRPVFDRQRKASVHFDWPRSSSCKKRTTSFREEYLDWKPPIFNIDVTVHLKSRKKQGSHCVEAEEGDHSLSLELRTLRNKVFDEMPQNPHYTPLDKYSGQVREGMILGLDVALVKLTEQIRKVVYSPAILHALKGFSEQVIQLEEMGYNVDKLKERLHNLQRIAESELASRAALVIIEDQVRSEEANVNSLKSLITKLEDRISGSQALITDSKCKIETLKQDSSDAVTEFETTAKSTWK